MSPADLVPRFTKSPRLLPVSIAAKLDTLVHVQMCPLKQVCVATLTWDFPIQYLSRQGLQLPGLPLFRFCPMVPVICPAKSCGSEICMLSSGFALRQRANPWVQIARCKKCSQLHLHSTSSGSASVSIGSPRAHMNLE